MTGGSEDNLLQMVLLGIVCMLNALLHASREVDQSGVAPSRLVPQQQSDEYPRIGVSAESV